LFFFYRKRLFNLFKNRIINKLKKFYRKPLYLKKQKYIFLGLKYLIRINRSNYKLENAVNLFYNFKSKYNPLRRKLYKIRKLYNKLRYLKFKKLNLIKISLIKIFFILNRLKILYKVSNGSFYNYMNSFDKSVAFISLNRIQGFWLKRKLRKDFTKLYSINWRNNIDFIFLNENYKLRNTKTFKILLTKFKKANYFLFNKIKYKIKLRNIEFNIENSIYNTYINNIIKLKNLKYKIYNFIKNKFIWFFLNYDIKYLINLKAINKDEKNNIKKRWKKYTYL